MHQPRRKSNSKTNTPTSFRNAIQHQMKGDKQKGHKQDDQEKTTYAQQPRKNTQHRKHPEQLPWAQKHDIRQNLKQECLHNTPTTTDRIWWMCSQSSAMSSTRQRRRHTNTNTWTITSNTNIQWSRSRCKNSATPLTNSNGAVLQTREESTQKNQPLHQKVKTRWYHEWVGDWRLVGQGLHHTSFTTPYITYSYHTNEVVSPLCFDRLVPGSTLCLQRGMFTKSTPMKSLCSRVRILHDVSLPLAARASFWQMRIYSCEEWVAMPVVLSSIDTESFRTCPSDDTSA